MFRHIESIFLAFFMIFLAAGCSKSVSFSADVQPILSRHCLECHKKGEKGHEQSGLSMDTYAELMSGTRYGPVIVPGDSISSTLVRLIDHKANKVINMPHDKSKIPDNEIELIKAWIDEGAKNN